MSLKFVGYTAGRDARPTIWRVDSDGLDACLKTLPSINLPAAYR
ncbi:hypothetical protein HMPREF9370_1658 [Neisseria wadsworthii 9715]|uniref:Uncharacterized protein n=1 Tax=Neisseria wadsworthii 9715 TaxID=1030841 RepID=G4CRE8_9NEIS|nr:hypothetical protein HMPREF9370_1658 [Neisseria wadsworthii 9715]